MTVKRDPNRFKRMYSDKRVVIPPEYGTKAEIREYTIYSSAGMFKIGRVYEGYSYEQKPSDKA